MYENVMKSVTKCHVLLLGNPYEHEYYIYMHVAHSHCFEYYGYYIIMKRDMKVTYM